LKDFGKKNRKERAGVAHTLNRAAFGPTNRVHLTVRGARGTRQVTVREAMLMKFTENALKGDPRALLTLIALNEKSRASGRGAGVHMPVSAEDLALLNSFVERSAKDAVLKPKDDEK
jgi:hypothetical protein